MGKKTASLRQLPARGKRFFLLVVSDADILAGRGEGRPRDVEPAMAGQQLVSIGAGAEEVHQALEMLQALMEDVAIAARESSAKAKAEKQRRFSEVVRIIKARRSQRKKILND